MKKKINPKCGFSNLVMMQRIIVMFNGVQELTKMFQLVFILFIAIHLT
jgi:hypothetical protein